MGNSLLSEVDFFGWSSTLDHSATQSDDTGTFLDNNRPNRSFAKLKFIDSAPEFFYPSLIDLEIGFISLLFRGMSIYFGVNVLFFSFKERPSVARARISGPLKSITKHSSPNERTITVLIESFSLSNDSRKESNHFGTHLHFD